MRPFVIVDDSEALEKSQQFLPQLRRFVLSCIVEELERTGEVVTFQDIPSWNFTSASDRDHYNAIFHSVPVFEGPTYISSLVTDRMVGQIHLVPNGGLTEYIFSHAVMFSEVFFNLDCILFSPGMRRWLLIHHNGLYADVILQNRF